MSGIINKIKDAVDPKSNHGPHPASTSASGTHPHGTQAGNTVTGTTGYGNTGVAEGTHGPHSSRIGNAVDPRVDSDRDHRAAGLGAGTGAGYTGTGVTNSGLGSSNHTSGVPQGMHGPHSSRIANTLDPRVDSDRDGSHTMGSTTGTHTGMTGPGAGYGNTSTTTGTTGVGHSHHGISGHGPSIHASGAPEGSVGPHGSRVANAMDPLVDSDLDGSHRTVGHHHSTGPMAGMHGTSAGVGGIAEFQPGPAPNTAGPHKSDLLNKMDPRVDSKQGGL
ncbi:hypothetical protein P8C59_007506 [Phyllachora maydis]|uniref:Uncharacterized protein n=1 Tax=Phyllachora maydis TaxID=1825666 RepID=A0AAD9I8P2_9PEZI|nr:hypothetical protein P8C59_007506 [Phyllachora maydis]